MQRVAGIGKTSRSMADLVDGTDFALVLDSVPQAGDGVWDTPSHSGATWLTPGRGSCWQGLAIDSCNATADAANPLLDPGLDPGTKPRRPVSLVSICALDLLTSHLLSSQQLHERGTRALLPEVWLFYSRPSDANASAMGSMANTTTCVMQATKNELFEARRVLQDRHYSMCQIDKRFSRWSMHEVQEIYADLRGELAVLLRKVQVGELHKAHDEYDDNLRGEWAFPLCTYKFL